MLGIGLGAVLRFAALPPSPRDRSRIVCLSLSFPLPDKANLLLFFKPSDVDKIVQKLRKQLIY